MDSLVWPQRIYTRTKKIQLHLDSHLNHKEKNMKKGKEKDKLIFVWYTVRFHLEIYSYSTPVRILDGLYILVALT